MASDVTVLQTRQVAPNSARRVDIDGHRIAVVRIENADGSDSWYAIGDECSHADWSLSEGDVWAEECELECPKHGSTFSLTTGAPQSLPATQPVPVYDIRVDGNDVIVTLP